MQFSTFSFFCPAYHDEANLPLLIPKVHAFLAAIADTYEIIIVEDGSPDRTGAVADQLAKTYPCVRVIHHPKNMGYGAALKTGFQSARYEYVMYTDGDNQYDVQESLPFLHLLNNADILSGYALKKATSWWRKLQSITYNIVLAILFGHYLRDVNCSMKIIRKSVLDSLKLESASAFIDAELILKARRQKYRILQFPVHHYARTAGRASGSRLSVIIPTIKDMLHMRFRL